METNHEACGDANEPMETVVSAPAGLVGTKRSREQQEVAVDTDHQQRQHQQHHHQHGQDQLQPVASDSDVCSKRLHLTAKPASTEIPIDVATAASITSISPDANQSTADRMEEVAPAVSQPAPVMMEGEEEKAAQLVPVRDMLPSTTGSKRTAAGTVADEHALSAAGSEDNGTGSSIAKADCSLGGAASQSPLLEVSSRELGEKGAAAVAVRPPVDGVVVVKKCEVRKAYSKFCGTAVVLLYYNVRIAVGSGQNRTTQNLGTLRVFKKKKNRPANEMSIFFSIFFVSKHQKPNNLSIF